MTKQTVKVGDAVVFEVMHPSELQRLLHTPGLHPDLNTEVEVKSISELEPWKVEITGCIHFNSDMWPYSFEVDLRGFEPEPGQSSTDKFLLFVGQLDAIFKKSRATLARPH